MQDCVYLTRPRDDEYRLYMSIGTLVGLIFGFSLFVGAILMSTDNFMMFVSLESLIMVLGGTIASSFISFQARYVWLALKNLYQIFLSPKAGREYLQAEVGKMIQWGYLVKKEGITALENEIGKMDDQPFLKQSVTLVVTGYSPDEMRDMLSDMADAEYVRGGVPAKILKYMGAGAPAFGMIGTLVGLIVMLDNLEGDPGGIGAGLAIALLTTLYGVIFARLIFIPAANKIQQNLDIEHFRNQLMMEGFVMLAEERAPRYIQDKMNCFLDSEIHYEIGSNK